MRTESVATDQAVAEAARRHRAGDSPGARRLCEQVLSRSPDHGPARHLAGLIAVQQGDLEIGLGHLDLVCARHPENPAFALSLAKALRQAGRRTEALDRLQRSLRNAGENIDIAIEASNELVALEAPSRAIPLLEEARRRAPDHPGVLTNLGSLVAQTGRIAEAVELLQRAIALAPDQAAAHYNLAKALRQAGDDEAAVRHYRRALELAPGFATAAHNLGNLLLDLGRVDEAAAAFGRAVRAKRTPGTPDRGLATFRRTNTSKLKHDIEQLEHLMARGLLGRDHEATAARYRAALQALSEAGETGPSVALPRPHLEQLASTYNRLMHLAEAPALPGPAVNPALDRGAIEADYRANGPGLTHFDGFLTAEALASLRRFCLDSTIWFGHRYANGYLGAFMDEGFCCPLLLQIAEELRCALPGIFGTATLRKLWAFKYDSQLSGIPMHADFAAVNVNFWITPDAANLDPESGGLVVWDKEAPLDWDFEAYNADEARMRAFLRDQGARAITVPHRQNRVVMFNSDLFHETGALNFKDGYENRRINITMLYGKRGDQ